MTLVEYFDPHNIEHLRAIKYLWDVGWWPQSFQDEYKSKHVTREVGDYSQLINKLAELYVNERLAPPASPPLIIKP
jgi:hypothetical protein